MSDSDILVQRGKPWFSWAIVVGVAMIAISGAGIYFAVMGGQREVLNRLATNEAAVVKAAETLDKIGQDMTAMRYDVNEALGDRWSNTDMKFLWAEVNLFWSEFARLNPNVQVPGWPPAKRVTNDESRSK